MTRKSKVDEFKDSIKLENFFHLENYSYQENRYSNRGNLILTDNPLSGKTLELECLIPTIDLKIPDVKVELLCGEIPNDILTIMYDLEEPIYELNQLIDDREIISKGVLKDFLKGNKKIIRSLDIYDNWKRNYNNMQDEDVYEFSLLLNSIILDRLKVDGFIGYNLINAIIKIKNISNNEKIELEYKDVLSLIREYNLRLRKAEYSSVNDIKKTIITILG